MEDTRQRCFVVYLSGVDTANGLSSLSGRKCFSIVTWKTFCLGTAFSLCIMSTPPLSKYVHLPVWSGDGRHDHP